MNALIMTKTKSSNTTHYIDDLPWCHTLVSDLAEQKLHVKSRDIFQLT